MKYKTARFFCFFYNFFKRLKDYYFSFIQQLQNKKREMKLDNHMDHVLCLILFLTKKNQTWLQDGKYKTGYSLKKTRKKKDQPQK